MEELWRGYTVDGSTAFAPGDDYGEDEGQDAWPQEEEEEFQATPSPMGRSSSTQSSKRSFASTSSTLTSPVKKSKSPMVKIVKDIANTFKEPIPSRGHLLTLLEIVTCVLNEFICLH